MQRKSSTLAKVALAASATLLLLATPATAAGPPLQGSGTGSITGVEITVLREVGGNSLQARTLTGTVNGTLTGSFVQEVIGIVHRNGRVTFGGVLVFTGTVDGCGDDLRGDDPHTIMLRVSGRGQAGLPVTEATVRVIKQPANTLDVTGHGTVSQEGMSLAYEIEYICR